MGIANESADFLLHLAHLETLSCRHAKHFDFVASSVSAAQGSERNFNGGQGITIETDAITRSSALSYDGIGNAVDLYFLATSICLARKKRFHNAGTDYAHLSVLHHVDVVESPSCLDARVVYFVIFREDATQAHAKRLVTLHGTASPVVARSCADIHLGNTVLHTVDVFQVQTPRPSLLQSLVGLGGVHRCHETSVRCKSREHLSEHRLQSASTAHQQHEHEDAPEDAEGSEE